jgi:hypothetical protein
MDTSKNFILEELQLEHFSISIVDASSSCSDTGSRVLILDIIVDKQC